MNRAGSLGKRWLVVVLVVATVVIGTAALVVWKGLFARKPTTTQTAAEVILPVSVCDHQLLERANPLINDNRSSELVPVVDEIKKRANYDHDPNCVYVLARFDVMSGALEQAKNDVARLKRFTVRDYDAALQPSTMSLTDFDNAVQTLARTSTIKPAEVDYDKIDAAGRQQ